MDTPPLLLICADGRGRADAGETHPMASPVQLVFDGVNRSGPGRPGIGAFRTHTHALHIPTPCPPLPD